MLRRIHDMMLCFNNSSNNHSLIDLQSISMKSFKRFGFKRKLGGFGSVKDFFELHSRTTKGKKTKIELKTTIPVCRQAGFSKLKMFKCVQCLK